MQQVIILAGKPKQILKKEKTTVYPAKNKNKAVKPTDTRETAWQ